ncbi:MAG: biotin transporter BioY [Aminivibrio sp.]|jgi:biotin transport system substrate-specific component
MRNKTSTLIMASLFTALTAIGAFIKIPTPMVPVTLQVMVVILSGFMLKPKAALFSQTAYVTIGLLGVPIFTEGGGIQYILSPTFGYLLGNIVGAWTVSLISNKNEHNSYLAAFSGLFVIYLTGASVLYCNLNLVAKIQSTIFTTLKIGVIPFIIPDTLKAIAAILLARKINKIF